MQIGFTTTARSGTDEGTDEHAMEWLERAKSGDSGARQALLGWAYGKARSYYLGKVRVESALTWSDAEDLTGAFLVEFHRAWPRVSAVRNYTRRMLRNNLNRYLQRKRLVRRRETPIARERESLYAVWSSPGPEETGADGWSDESWRRRAAIETALASVDELTHPLILLRMGSEKLGYRDLALRLGATESALRMRAARFYRVVRDEHDRLVRVAAR